MSKNYVKEIVEILNEKIDKIAYSFFFYKICE